MLKFKNDSQQLHDEFHHAITEPLRVILYNLAGYLESNHQKDLTLTSLIRTDNPASVHAYGRGADAETSNLTEQERMSAEDFINKNFPYASDGRGIKTILYEYAGQIAGGRTSTGNHWHIQTRV